MAIRNPELSHVARPQSRRKARWLWLVLPALIVAGAWFVLQRQTHAQMSVSKRTSATVPVVPVVAALAMRGDVPVYLDGLGSVAAYYTVTARTRVDGQIMKVYFSEGEFVHKNDLLAEIDERPFRVQLEQAEGQMAKDQASLADARLDLERYRTLLSEDAIPKQLLDTQIATVGQFEGAVKADQAAIDNARLQLTYSRITSPIDGVVGLRLVDPGNIVHASDAGGLLVITQVQPITVIFTLPEDSVGPVLEKLRAGARLKVDAYNRDKSRKLASGHLMTTDNEIDQNTGTLKLKAEFENRDNTLFPNQFVNVRLLVETRRSQVIVPTVSIQRGSQGTFVFVISPDGTVAARRVSAGIAEGNNTSIDNGLSVGEMVVTEGAENLQPGSKVAVRPEAGLVPAADPPGNSPGR